MPISSKFDYHELVTVLERRKRFIIIVSLICIFVGVVAFVLSPKRFRSTTTILIIPQRVSESYVHSTVSLRIEDRLATMRQQIMSRTHILSIINELKLFQGKRKKIADEELVEMVRKRMELQVRGNDSFVLSFTHEDGRMAMLTTSKLASYFIDENLKIREQQAVGTSDFLESQLQETKKKLEDQENIVKQYRMKYMGQLPQQLEANIAALNRWQDQYRSISETIRSTEDRKIFYESQLNALRKIPPVYAQDERVTGRMGEPPVALSPEQEILRELRTKKGRLAELSAKYTEIHPEIRSIKRDIGQLEKRISNFKMATDNGTSAQPPVVHANPPEIRDIAREQEAQRLVDQIKSSQLDIATLNKRLKDIEKNIVDVQRKVESIPKREQELYSITRDYDNLKVSYNELLRKKLDAQVSANLEKQQKGMQFQIVDPPNLPESPIYPSRKVFAGITLFLAFALGIGGSIGMEFFDKKLKGKEDFKKYFDLPVLATLPILPDNIYYRKNRMNNILFMVSTTCLVLFTIVVLLYNLMRDVDIYRLSIRNIM